MASATTTCVDTKSKVSPNKICLSFSQLRLKLHTVIYCKRGNNFPKDKVFSKRINDIYIQSAAWPTPYNKSIVCPHSSTIQRSGRPFMLRKESIGGAYYTD